MFTYWVLKVRSAEEPAEVEVWDVLGVSVDENDSIPAADVLRALAKSKIVTDKDVVKIGEMIREVQNEKGLGNFEGFEKVMNSNCTGDSP